MNTKVWIRSVTDIQSINEKTQQMKSFIKIVFYLNFIFGGVGIISALFTCFIYNGFGEVFEFVKPDRYESNETIDWIKNTKTLEYKYFVHEKEYNDKQTIVLRAVEEDEFYIENLSYNKTLPGFSRVGNGDIKFHQAKVGFILSGIYLIFIFLIYRFANLDKWISIYSGTYVRPEKKKK